MLQTLNLQVPSGTKKRISPKLPSCHYYYYQYRNCPTMLTGLGGPRACLARQETVPARSASTNRLSGQPRSSLPRQATVPARSTSTKSPSGQPRSSLPRQATVPARLAGSLSLPTTAPTISLSTSLLRTICNDVLASSGPCLESSYYY